MSLYQYIKKTNIGVDYSDQELIYVNPKYQYLNGEDYFCSAKEHRKMDSMMYQYPDPGYRAIYNIEQECLNPKCRYLSSEGRHHCDIEQDYSNPQCGLGWRHAYEGPTVVNINVQETYDVTQIKDYVLQLLDEKTEGLAENITEAAIQKMQNNINLTVDQAIQQAFVEMTREAIDQAFETE